MMRTVSILRAGIALFVLAAFSACSQFGRYNEEISKADPEPVAGDPALKPVWPKNPHCFHRVENASDRTPFWGDDVLALTLSGGGSRAAVLGAAVMFELQDIGALESVDFISSVSGGSVPAALYALSRDPEDENVGEYDRIAWSHDDIMEMVKQDYLFWWGARWFRPDNIVKYWFTAYDRTDIFADTLNGGLFDDLGRNGGYPTFSDLNQNRPTLIVNATNFTRDRPHDVFTFTPWHFQDLANSDICSYSLAHGVAASAAFPGVFTYSTLQNYKGLPTDDPDDPGGDAYIHLMDGGATDNLGLKGLNEAMEYLRVCGELSYKTSPIPGVEDSGQATQGPDCAKRLVVVVDAQNGFEGRDNADYEVRGFVDRFIDRNFLDAYDTLMHTGYGQILRTSRTDIEEHGSGQKRGSGLMHLPLLALIQNGWLGYGGQYNDPVPCVWTEPAQPEPDSFSGNDQSASISACNLIKGARAALNELLDGRSEKEYSIKLRRTGTDWNIEDDRAACLEVAAYALVRGAVPKLEEFFGRQLGTQNVDRAKTNMSTCLADSNERRS